MISITSYVNGDFECLLACADLADYADTHDLYVDKLTISKTGVDNWTVSAELLPNASAYMGAEFDEIPF